MTIVYARTRGELGRGASWLVSVSWQHCLRIFARSLAFCPGMRYICGMPTTNTPVQAAPAVRAAWAALDASIAAATCRICGKFATHRHVRETRAAHAAHLTRYGWSGMCAAPQQQH
jgi:hypothetical protein